MRSIISPDRLLSAWIVVYSWIYLFGITHYNPIILLCIAYSFTMLSSIYIALKSNDNTRLFTFIIINSFLKLIPIALIWKEKIFYNDIIFSYIFVIIYIAYMYIVDDDIICTYKDIVLHIINKDIGRSTILFDNVMDIIHSI